MRRHQLLQVVLVQRHAVDAARFLRKTQTGTSMRGDTSWLHELRCGSVASAAVITGITPSCGKITSCEGLAAQRR